MWRLLSKKHEIIDNFYDEHAKILFIINMALTAIITFCRRPFLPYLSFCLEMPLWQSLLHVNIDQKVRQKFLGYNLKANILELN